MSAKDDLITKLDQGYDTDLLNVLDRTLGTVTTLPMPTTVSQAIILNSQVAVNFNNAWLVPLSGVPLVKLMLHVGQRNRTLQEILIAGLKLRDVNQQTCSGTQAKDYVGIQGLPELPGIGIFEGLAGDVTVEPPNVTVEPAQVTVNNNVEQPEITIPEQAQQAFTNLLDDLIITVKTQMDTATNDTDRSIPKSGSRGLPVPASSLSWFYWALTTAKNLLPVLFKTPFGWGLLLFIAKNIIDLAREGKDFYDEWFGEDNLYSIVERLDKIDLVLNRALLDNPTVDDDPEMGGYVSVLDERLKDIRDKLAQLNSEEMERVIAALEDISFVDGVVELPNGGLRVHVKGKAIEY